MLGNPYQAYKQQSVLTMTPGDLLLALFDRLAKELTIATVSIEKRDISEINRSLQKSQLILKHLLDTLDFKYDIANNLSALYEYFTWVTVQANLKKDAKDLIEVTKMVLELRATFAEADKEVRRTADPAQSSQTSSTSITGQKIMEG